VPVAEFPPKTVGCQYRFAPLHRQEPQVALGPYLVPKR
jgi:hypothetical protein